MSQEQECSAGGRRRSSTYCDLSSPQPMGRGPRVNRVPLREAPQPSSSSLRVLGDIRERRRGGPSAGCQLCLHILSPPRHSSLQADSTPRRVPVLLHVDNEVGGCVRQQSEQREGLPHPPFSFSPRRQPDGGASLGKVVGLHIWWVFHTVVSATLNQQSYE